MIELESDSIERRLNRRIVYLTVRQQARLSKYEYDTLLELSSISMRISMVH